MLDAARIVEMQQLVRQVVVAPHVQDYAVRAVLATHPEGEFATALAGRYVRYGASPRAAQALVLGAKVRALVEGRGHVSVDDLRAVLRPALRHRLVLNFEAHAEAVEPDTVLDDLLATLPLDAPAPAGA